jgi:hypothetical protein
VPTHTIFYSWQSDLPNTCTSGFIQDCLEEAIKQIQADEELKLEPSLDRDVKGASGSADIAATLFRKIRAADVFVGDVSIINPNRSVECRPTPNPNVLAELGYAAGFHGWERVVCVVNTAFGQIDELPFDIRQRRVLDYELRPEEDGKAPRKALAGMLRNAIRDVLAHPHHPGKQAQSSILLDCPLTEDEYDMPPVRVHANQYQRFELRLDNPLEKTLANVHVCYKEFDLFYMPWRYKVRSQKETVAGGYNFYWLNDNQLKELEKKSQMVRFILNGTRCGVHDLVVVWNTEGIAHQRTITVVVEPEPG